ncbi:GATOR complex protein NPRL3 [Homalodisca vitripennis]|uniref:GATOR complex protein NPRL3 n=1 Tax=Homalodisca vitripennis TaxID=197043 RepID=UPI001EECA238|nr:GATOR complex protein NPRL3 [Homalodisca vitripennis]
MEADPISVILVKSDSKGDRLLFRYPHTTDIRSESSQQNRKKNTYCFNTTEDVLHSPAPQTFNIDKGHLTGFTDEVLSTLFAVKQELCEMKFELKVNDVRFVGHPTLLQSSSRKGSSDSKQGNPSCVLINIVFALQAVANHSIVKCYYDLSRRLGVALRHEEKRCGYVTDEMKKMIMAHDEVSVRHEEEGCKVDNNKTSPFEIILKRCSLACALRTVYDDLISSGLVRLRINRWIQLTFCLPQKVHQFNKKGFMIEPETIDRCLQSLRPYHGLLLLIEPGQLLESLPLDSSPALLRLLKMYSPLKSLQTLSADADLTLAQVFNLTGHLVYWGNAIIIYPLCESNVYVLSPDAPTNTNSPLVEKFSEHFPGESLLQVMSEFSLPVSLRYKLSPVSQPQQATRLLQTVVWLLQNRLLLQLHTYTYFMPTENGLSQTQDNNQGRTISLRESSLLSTPEDTLSVSVTREASETDASSTLSDEGVVPSMTTVQTNNWLDRSTESIIHEDLLTDFTEEERAAILKLPAASNADDLKLLVRLVQQGYLHGTHHLEEIMYLENVRRSQLLQLLDKFREVLITCEMEDPAISMFYLHSS